MIENKQINYLISQIFLLTYITTFEPETPAGHPKYQRLAPRVRQSGPRWPKRRPLM